MSRFSRTRIGIASVFNIDALDGGQVLLDQVVSATQPNAVGVAIYNIRADDNGFVDLSSLTELLDTTQGNSTIEASNGGEVRVPLLEHLSQVILTDDQTGTLPISQISGMAEPATQ